MVIDVAGVATYPLANGHGDIVGTTDVAGAFVPAPPTDEFGVGDPPPDRLGWLGAHQRYSTGGELQLIRMGVRLYDPALGRFHQVDPVEGGNANDYDYVYGDPVNNLDLDGKVCGRKGLWGWKKCRWGEGAAGVVNIAWGGRKLGKGIATLVATRGVPTPGAVWNIWTGAGRTVRGFRQGYRFATSSCSGDCSARGHLKEFGWGVVPFGGFIRKQKTDWIDKWGSF